MDIKSNFNYIEVLRAIATAAVVFLHINMTLPANFNASVLGVGNYAYFHCGYMIVCWAVPIFFMISGALLLNTNKIMTPQKIWGYIKRMLLVLLFFGSTFAFMELYFIERTINFSMIVKSIFFVLEGKSWDHLWYIYIYIGLLMLTIPLKLIVDNSNHNELEKLLLFLFIGSFLVPTINRYFDLSIKTFMLINDCVIYYILGYYLSVTKRKFVAMAKILFPISILVLCIGDLYGAYYDDNLLIANMMGNNFFRAVSACSLFLIIKNIFSGDLTNITKLILNCSLYIKPLSFGIYLVHPFWINLLYKVFKITPLSGEIVLMTFLLWILILLASALSTYILVRMPILSKII